MNAIGLKTDPTLATNADDDGTQTAITLLRSLVDRTGTLSTAGQSLYSKIKGTPTSASVDIGDTVNEKDIITEVTVSTVTNIDYIYVDYIAWLADVNIVTNDTLTIRFYMDNATGTLSLVDDLTDIITKGVQSSGMIRIGPIGSFERNFKLTAQSSKVTSAGVATKTHYVAYDKE